MEYIKTVRKFGGTSESIRDINMIKSENFSLLLARFHSINDKQYGVNVFINLCMFVHIWRCRDKTR